MESLRDTLQQCKKSLTEVESMIEEDQDSEDLLQMRADLQASIQEIEASLAHPDKQSPPAESNAPQIVPPSALAESVPTAENSEGHAAASGGAQEEQAHGGLGSPGFIGAAAPPTAKRTAKGGGEGDGSSREAKRGRRDPQIHPQNAYAAAEPDFAKLAGKDARLRPYVALDARGRGRLDFTDANACRELTRALLEHDYGIHWHLRPGQLIPAVTNRANYIHWLQDLLRLSSPPGEVRGLDIGCGANLIYCLLGASCGGWQMVGVDITPEAGVGARRNLEANPHLSSLIDLRIRQDDPGISSKGILLPAIKAGESFAFTMCNPPFFASWEEAGQNPGTDFQGSGPEMVCPGGELAFVSQIVQDSRQLQDRVHWYTTMVGKKASLKAIKQQLHSSRVSALRITEFAQGRTSRWGIAWSFSAAARATESAPLPRADAQKRPLLAKRQTSFQVQAKSVLPQKILETLASILQAAGTRCKTDLADFAVQARLPHPQQDSKEPSKPKEPSSEREEHIDISIKVVVERQGLYAVQAKIPQQSSQDAAALFTATLQTAESDLKQILGLQ